jgi:hypothetical protein
MRNLACTYGPCAERKLPIEKETNINYRYVRRMLKASKAVVATRACFALLCFALLKPDRRQR